MPPRARSERALRKEALYGPPLPRAGMGGDELPARDAWDAAAMLRVGTSGWAYRHWLGRLYPRALASDEMRSFYARRFPAVEVNSTYYRLPSADVFRRWRDATPPGFLFSVKAPGIVTHEKRLVDVDEDAAEFLARAKLLGDKLGIVLWQFPPGFKADALPLLERFLDRLPPGTRHAVELRHRSWFERDVRALCEREGVAFVVHDHNRKGGPVWATAPSCYLRLHGPTGRYRGSYDVETLLQWSELVKAWLGEGREVWCFLNNDERGKGVRNAIALREFSEAASPAAPRSQDAKNPSAWGH